MVKNDDVQVGLMIYAVWSLGSVADFHAPGRGPGLNQARVGIAGGL